MSIEIATSRDGMQLAVDIEIHQEKTTRVVHMSAEDIHVYVALDKNGRPVAATIIHPPVTSLL